MTKASKTIAAFRCPQCGSGILSAVGITNIAASAGRVILRCSDSECPASKADKGDTSFCMDVRAAFREGETKLDISVPCIFCKKPHVYSAAADMIEARSRDEGSLALTCPVSGIDLGFIGEENHVKAELARAELELLNQLDENNVSDMDDFRNEEGSLPDPEITDIINFVVRDLESEGKIFCGCVPNDDGSCSGEYETVPGPGYVTVSCSKCGRARVIPAVSLISAHSLLEISSMTLE